LTDPNQTPSELESSSDEASPVDGALEALFAEALELQDERKKAEQKDDLDAMISENYGDTAEEEAFSDDDPDLALPDLPDDDLEESSAGAAGVDPEIVERLESEIEMLKQQKKHLHEQMAQRASRFESAENRLNQLEQQLVIAARQNQSLARDFENFRGRTEREKEQQKMLAAEKLLRAFLAVYDNLDRALEHAETKDGPLGEGVAMTLNQFLATLEASGATLAPCEVGMPFDPTYHEAMQQEHSDEVPEGSVLTVLQSGFLLGDRLLRATMVCVSQGPEPGKKPAKKRKKRSPARKAKASAQKKKAAAASGPKKKAGSRSTKTRKKKTTDSAAKQSGSE